MPRYFPKTYTMTAQKLSTRQTYGRTTFCHRCQQKVCEGEKVVSRLKKIYHKKCWDGLFIDA